MRVRMKRDTCFASDIWVPVLDIISYRKLCVTVFSHKMELIKAVSRTAEVSMEISLLCSQHNLYTYFMLL